MRARSVVLLILLLAVAAVPHANAGTTSHSACRVARQKIVVRLPAPLTIRTSCGAFQIGMAGSVRPTTAASVPAGTSWWPSTGVWDRLAGGHLLVGRWQKPLWRSSGRFPVAYRVGAVTVGPGAVAFSYGDREIELYLAALGGRERPVARGEYPLGWTQDGLYTRSVRGGELRLRTSAGTLRETLARDVFTYAYDSASGSLYFVAHGSLIRADGTAQARIASLARLGLAAGRMLQLQPLGRLVALRDNRWLVVLRSDGAVFASTRLPHESTRQDRISSQVSAAPAARAVAFTATRGNTANGSSGSETVYLLRPGWRSARPIHRERVHFAICERGAELAWHGSWLLYTASEGNTAVIDSRRPAHAIELTHVVRNLPGVSGDEGNLNVTVSWSDARSLE